MADPPSLHSLRFSLDSASEFGFLSDVNMAHNKALSQRFICRHVLVTEALLPTLHSQIQQAKERLDIQSDVTAFVSADESLNASCTTGNDGSIILWISSGIVKLLDEHELSFVLGHEIGHWFLEHSQYPAIDPSDSNLFIARQNLSRAAELSADRFGVIVCRDIDVAIRAIVKSASGLPDAFLGGNLSQFIDQVREMPSSTAPLDEIFASHPPMPLRAKAMLWYSMSDDYLSRVGKSGGTCLETIDGYIERDLDRLWGKQFVRTRTNDFKTLIFWISVSQLSKGGTLSQDDQLLLKNAFGDRMLQRLKDFLQGMDRARVHRAVENRLADALDRIRIYPQKQFTEHVGRFAEVAPLISSYLAKTTIQG